MQCISVYCRNMPLLSKKFRLPGFGCPLLVVSLSVTGDVSILVTLLPPSFRLDSSFICFLMLNKAAFVLWDILHSIYCVCSWTLNRLCDLCLSDSLYFFFVKYFNKMKLFFITHCETLVFSRLWPLLLWQVKLVRQWLSVFVYVCVVGDNQA